jgi:hypothetical protein
MSPKTVLLHVLFLTAFLTRKITPKTIREKQTPKQLYLKRLKSCVRSRTMKQYNMLDSDGI